MRQAYGLLGIALVMGTFVLVGFLFGGPAKAMPQDSVVGALHEVANELQALRYTIDRQTRVIEKAAAGR